jgi:hypothetical protein
MKKILAIFGVLIGLAVILLMFTSHSGAGLTLGSFGHAEDKAYVEKSTLDFLEDIKYKDFKKAAIYHTIAERKTVDIPSLLERIFLIKPEFCDFLRYQITGVDVDSTGTRARVHTKCVIKVLNSNEIKEPETIFYWFKDPKEGWCMHLESSLH